jgi:peroxiredoxin
MNTSLAFIATLVAILLPSISTAAEEKPRFFCDRTALTAEQRVQIRTFGHTLHDAVQGTRELPDGYEFEFASDAPVYQALVQYIPLERACCPFFEFNVRVAPSGGKLYWTLTGPDGIKEFIREELSWLFRSTAANWRLQGLDGRSYELAKLRGKAVVLSFWATWCAPCRIETKWLARLYEQYRAQGLEIIGISMDEATDDAEVARFAAKYAVPYPILLRGQSIADQYGGIQYLPQMFFVDRTGRIVKQTRGIHDSASLEAEILQLLKINSLAATAAGLRSALRPR